MAPTIGANRDKANKWKRWMTVKSKGEPAPNRRRLWTTQAEKMEELMALARAASEEPRDETPTPSPSQALVEPAMERTTPTQRVLREARREVMTMPEEGEEEVDDPALPRARHLGFYLRRLPGKTQSVGSVGSAQLEIEMHRAEEGRWGLKAREMDSKLLLACERPVFFSPAALHDPVSLAHNTQRMFKRDGTVRDRFKGSASEAQLRDRHRSASCPPLSLPVAAMVALEAAPTRLPTAAAGSARASVDGSEEGGGARSRRGGLRMFGGEEAGAVFVPQELARARAILEREFEVQPATAAEAPPMTPIVNTELVLERMRKGLSAWDPVLLGGRERHVLAKPQRAEAETDTREMSTAAMIQAHLGMLDKTATDLTDQTVRQFARDQEEATEALHGASAPLVAQWEGRLVELRRIRGEVLELSRMSGPVEVVTERMQHEQRRIGAVLRSATDARLARILAAPPLAALVPKHPDCFKSARRREQLQQMRARMDDQRAPLAAASRVATELFARTLEQIAPLEEQIQHALHHATASPAPPHQPAEGQVVVPAGAGDGVDINVLHSQIAKIHHAYAESEALAALDAIAQEVLDGLVELDRVAGQEERLMSDCAEQAAMQHALDQERQRVEEWNDLTKKIDWCFNDNPPDVGRAALNAVLAVTRRILLEPEAAEHRSVSANSRVSVITLILEARWGSEVLTAFGFYRTKFTWSVPTQMALDKMNYGCKYLCKRLDIPDHLLLLYLQRRSTTVPMELVKGMLDGFAHLQPGGADIFHDSSSSSDDDDDAHLAHPLDGGDEGESAMREEEEEEQATKPPPEKLQQRRRGYMVPRRSAASTASADIDLDDDDDEEEEEDGDGRRMSTASAHDEDASEARSGGQRRRRKKRRSSVEDGLGLAQFHGKLSPGSQSKTRGKRGAIAMGEDDGGDGKMVSFGGEGVGELDVVDVDQDALKIQEEALEKLFVSLDEDRNGRLTVLELKAALKRFRISVNRTSAKEMLREVSGSGEEGLDFHTFLSVMRRLLAEGQEDDPATLHYDELEDDQRSKVAAMLRRWLSERASNAFGKWQGFVDSVADKKKAIMDNYRSLCGHLRTSPGVSTVLQDWLTSRTQPSLDLSKRGLSVSGLKACVCALHGRMPDFDRIEELGEEPAQYLHQHPELTFAVTWGDGVDIFSLRSESSCGALHALDLSDNDFRAEGTLDLVRMLTRCCRTLHSLDVSGNAIGERGAEHLSALLRDPDGSRFTHLKLARNRVGDVGGAVVVAAIAESEQRRTLAVLDMAHNELGEQAAERAGGLLADHKAVLTHLDLSWNLIRKNAAVELFEGLRLNRTLQELRVQWNGLGSDRACHRLGEALKVCVLRHLDVGHCSITGTGAHLIAPGLKKNALLRTLILDGNNIKQAGARALYKATCAANRAEEERLQMSTVDCNLGILDSLSFNKSEPAGKYSLDMSSPYDRVTFVELMSLVWEGKGVFMPFPPPRIDETYSGTFRQYTIQPPETSEEDDWWVPDKGVLEFSYGSLRSSSAHHQETMSKDEMSLMVSVLTDREKKERDRIDAIRTFCEGDTFLRFDQVKGIMEQHLRDNRSAERVELVRQCYNRLIEAEMAPDLLDLLNQNERLAVERHLGVLARAFTKNNPTGFYRLDLSKKPQRDICLRLFELQNSQRELIADMDAYYAPRAGGPRPDLDRTWRNGRIDGEPHSHSPDWAVPYRGFLEVDFAQIIKPAPDARPASEEEFALLSEKLDLHNASMTRIKIIRDWSNRNLFLCQHIHRLLRLFSMETEQALRVEVLVIAFSRTVDWHGYRNLVQIITAQEHDSLVRRVGASNLFDEVMAVGYYECDLAIPDQRFVAQELVHLALVEPGENCVDTQYNGVDLSIPAGWAKELPRRGLLSMYYCREQQCIEKVTAEGSWRESNAPHTVNGKVPDQSKSTFTVWYLREFCEGGHTQPAGTEWVRKFRMRRIKVKMMKLASGALEMFSLLDTDGGGTLDRKELAMGLFRLGVWLHPSEMQALVDALDEDGGGTIDMDEFTNFWNDTALDRDWELPKDAPLKKQPALHDLAAAINASPAPSRTPSS